MSEKKVSRFTLHASCFLVLVMLSMPGLRVIAAYVAIVIGVGMAITFLISLTVMTLKTRKRPTSAMARSAIASSARCFTRLSFGADLIVWVAFLMWTAILPQYLEISASMLAYYLIYSIATQMLSGCVSVIVEELPSLIRTYQHSRRRIIVVE